MNNELEDFVNTLQHNAALKSAREIEKSRAYQEGYAQGVEDLYKYIRSQSIMNANKQN